jgi:hypothetical protein
MVGAVQPVIGVEGGYLVVLVRIKAVFRLVVISLKPRGNNPVMEGESLRLIRTSALFSCNDTKAMRLSGDTVMYSGSRS